jgi:hypothetical protein
VSLLLLLARCVSGTGQLQNCSLFGPFLDKLEELFWIGNLSSVASARTVVARTVSAWHGNGLLQP